MKPLWMVATGTGLALCVLAMFSPRAAGQSAPASRPATDANKEQARKDGNEYYNKIVNAYMHSRWTDLQDKLAASGPYQRLMSGDQQKDIAYIRKMIPEYRPDWWLYTKSSVPKKFQAVLWGKPTTADFYPGDWMEATTWISYYSSHIWVTVTWPPSKVDSPRPAGGELAGVYAMTAGDVTEPTVWRELGHNYVLTSLPTKTVVDLYRSHELVFTHIADFYSQMTAMYQCSPHGRLAALLMSLSRFDNYREASSITRAAHVTGAMLLQNVLKDPSKWPSFHLPPEVPANEVELNTIRYVLEHIDTNYTIAEDKALRDYFGEFVRSKGAGVLSVKAEVPLPEKFSFLLMAADDHDMQGKRDAWVSEKLTAAIKAGLVDKDKPKAKAGNGPNFSRPRLY